MQLEVSKFFKICVCILCLLSYMASCGYLRTKDGIYLVPKGYEGEVLIVFDQPDGVTPTIEDGLYVYKIPEDGVLKVKSPLETGFVNLKYFYIDDSGRREEIRYLRITGDRDIHGESKDKFDGQINADEYENGIFAMSYGVDSGKIVSFFVGRPKNSEILYEKMVRRVNKILLRRINDKIGN